MPRGLDIDLMMDDYYVVTLADRQREPEQPIAIPETLPVTNVGSVVMDDTIRVGWENDAECKGQDPNIFHPTERKAIKLALKFCDVCPVKVDCLETAIKNKDYEGIKGGLTQHQRRRLVRKRNKANSKLETS